MNLMPIDPLEIPQLDLFTGEIGTVVGRPQLASPEQIQAARDRRDLGMTRSSAKADRVLGDWQGQALHTLTVFLLTQGDREFLAEEFVEFAQKAGLDDPPDKRAYGSVVQSAARRGLIEKTGYKMALTSNLSPKCLWRAVGRLTWTRYPPIEERMGEV